MTVSPALPARPSCDPPVFHLLAKPTGAAWQGVANLVASFFRRMSAGADLALIDGVSAERLLAALEGKFT